ncbi:MAG: LysR family transcriptional regulator, partial [Myxococcota bacterium]
AHPRAMADLTLLETLEALLDTGSVTEAGKRLGLSQSAVSHRLRRLRESLGDSLFVPGPHGLVPTERARTLAGPVREGLGTLRGALRETRPFDPNEERTLCLAGSDGTELGAAPRMLAAVRAEAPGLKVITRPRVPGWSEALARGGLDLVIVPAGVPGVSEEAERPALIRRKLFNEDFVVLTRKGHPGVGERLTLAQYLALDHVLISPTGSEEGIVDRVLAARGKRRRVAFQLAHFSSGPVLIAETDLALTCPDTLGRDAAALLPVQAHPPPLPLPSVPILLVWHRRSHEDPAHRWLRERLAAGLARD